MGTVDPCNCVGAWTGMHSPACPRGGGFPAPIRDATPPLPAMPASVRELVEAATAAADGFCYGVAATGCTSDDPDIKANANRCIGEIRQIRERVERAIASVEAHYEKGGR